MSSTRILFAGDTPGAPLHWRRVSRAGAVDGRGTDHLADIAQATDEPVILVLPGTTVTAHEIALAARSERQTLEAAPFAIEDQVGSDLEAVHVALSPPGPSRTAYVVEHSDILTWRDALAEHGLQVARVLPDYMALPEPVSDEITLVDLPERTILRDGGWGASIDHQLGRQVVFAILASRGEDRRVVSPDGDGLDLLALGAERSSTNLLQGQYAPRRAVSQVDFSRFGRAGVLAAIAALGFVAYTTAEGFVLRGQANTVAAETEAAFRTAFPEVERVVNPRAQLRTVGTQPAADAPDFLILSGWLTRAAEAEPGVSVEAVRYDSQTGELVASVGFRDYEVLGRFRSAIERAGGIVEEGGSQQAANDARAGEITVRRP